MKNHGVTIIGFDLKLHPLNDLNGCRLLMLWKDCAYALRRLHWSRIYKIYIFALQRLISITTQILYMSNIFGCCVFMVDKGNNSVFVLLKCLFYERS